jgi:ABC-type antimicrobial peptide transport system permease subunit
MLEKELAARNTGLNVSSEFAIDTVGASDQIYRVRDIKTGTFLELLTDSKKANVKLKVEPAWDVVLSDARLATALLRLQGVVDAYSIVMFVVVLVLAASASLLLAFGHVLRKTRDLGLLLANGAAPWAVFLIYMSQIVLITVTGWTVGVLVSLFGAPYLESAAAQTLKSVLQAAASSQELGFRAVLYPTPIAIVKAFLWVAPAAFVGGLYPVWQASRADPLSSLSKVI